MEQLPDHANKCYSSGSSSRQSSTRWSPTTEQIRILKELYYNNGVRSPTADQIQRISAKLRQYGKIEGKNVFYWFQNHKARERQKKRFTTTASANHDIYMRPPPPPMPHHMYYNKFTPPPPGGMLGNYGYHQPAPPQNFPWSSGYEGFDPYCSSEQTLEMEMEVGEGEEEEEEERETLPLFPIHGDTIKVQQQQGSSEYGYNGSNCFSATSSRASLELSLSSSYGYM